MKPPLALYLVTSTSCNVNCKTCPAHREETHNSGFMSLKMLNDIMKKCTSEARVYYCQLFLYNEPTLIPHIGEMIKCVHTFGVPVFMSSNLVISKNIKQMLDAEPETLLISVSGWTQEIYERSHKGGDIEKVKDNMKFVRDNVSPKTHVQVSWHRYKYNEHEEVYMQQYTEMLGFTFVPYTTSLLPHTAAMNVWRSGIDDPHGEDCVVDVKSAKEACFDRKNWPCYIQDKTLSINAAGEYMHCSQRNDTSNIAGNLFSTTIKDIFKQRKSSFACLTCKAVGAHVYAQQSYMRSKWSPIRLAENIYHKLNLNGRFTKFTLWATHNIYMRPQKTNTV